MPSLANKIRPMTEADFRSYELILRAYNMQTPSEWSWKESPVYLGLHNSFDTMLAGGAYHRFKVSSRTVKINVGAQNEWGLPTERQVGWITGVAVMHRRCGQGTRIVKALLENAYAQHGIEEVWLETMFWNRKFYESLGFEFKQIKTVPGYAGWRRNNRRCCLMVRKIA